MRVVIIGSGNVGSTFANLLYQADMCDVLLINHNKIKADSNVLDILDCSVVCNHHSIVSGSYSDIIQTDIVVNCAGDSSLLRCGNRMGELDNSRRIANDIITQLNKTPFNGVFINTMNPCDEITTQFQNLNVDNSQILGTGTLLETLRLRRIVFEQYNLLTSAYVVGNHGDNNLIVSDSTLLNISNLGDLLTDVQNRVWKIYSGKGFTNFGICNALMLLVKSILCNTYAELCVSTLIADVYGLHNVAVSVPCIIGSKGVVDIVRYPEVEEALYYLERRT